MTQSLAIKRLADTAAKSLKNPFAIADDYDRMNAQARGQAKEENKMTTQAKIEVKKQLAQHNLEWMGTSLPMSYVRGGNSVSDSIALACEQAIDQADDPEGPVIEDVEFDAMEAYIVREQAFADAVAYVAQEPTNKPLGDNIFEQRR